MNLPWKLVREIETIQSLVVRKNGNGESCGKMVENMIRYERKTDPGKTTGVQESQRVRKGQNMRM
jgi:hypothetical protein